MKVELLTEAEHLAKMEHNAAIGALTCRGNTEKEFVASEVLSRIIKAGHESVLEHINLTYSIKGISRALLQELARHRHISLSVESTRHTLKKNVETCEGVEDLYDAVPSRYHYVLRDFLEFTSENTGLTSNDELKYFIPEFWPTNLVLTSNVRELRHILNLRTAPAALKEFRELARAMYEAVPEEFKYMLKDCVHKEAEV